MTLSRTGLPVLIMIFGFAPCLADCKQKPQTIKESFERFIQELSTASQENDIEFIEGMFPDDFWVVAEKLYSQSKEDYIQNLITDYQTFHERKRSVVCKGVDSCDLNLHDPEEESTFPMTFFYRSGSWLVVKPDVVTTACTALKRLKQWTGIEYAFGGPISVRFEINGQRVLGHGFPIEPLFAYNKKGQFTSISRGSSFGSFIIPNVKAGANELKLKVTLREKFKPIRIEEPATFSFKLFQHPAGKKSSVSRRVVHDHTEHIHEKGALEKQGTDFEQITIPLSELPHTFSIRFEAK